MVWMDLFVLVLRAGRSISHVRTLTSSSSSLGEALKRAVAVREAPGSAVTSRYCNIKASRQEDVWSPEPAALAVTSTIKAAWFSLRTSPRSSAF